MNLARPAFSSERAYGLGLRSVLRCDADPVDVTRFRRRTLDSQPEEIGREERCSEGRGQGTNIAIAVSGSRVARHCSGNSS